MLSSAGYESHEAMFADIKAASKKAAEEAGISCVIPSGELIESMVSENIAPIYRDGYHLSLGIGRYAVAALWYERLTGKKIAENGFCKFDEAIDEKTIEQIKRLIEKSIVF
jgi:hypothetical protein